MDWKTVIENRSLVNIGNAIWVRPDKVNAVVGGAMDGSVAVHVEGVKHLFIVRECDEREVMRRLGYAVEDEE